MKPSKCYIINEIEKMIVKNPRLSILDLGSGQSLNFTSLITTYPTITYTGLEPQLSEVAIAKKTFIHYPNASFLHTLGYEDTSNLLPAYDLVVSLSVLEHVKDLEKFLQFSASKAKTGGNIIHLYDLGHSLHPKSLKERLHVYLCGNRFTKKCIPETKFASYVDSDKVCTVLEKSNAHVTRVTNHCMRDHVKLIKYVEESAIQNTDLLTLAASEVLWASKIRSKTRRETLFPAVCIWGTKK